MYDGGWKDKAADGYGVMKWQNGDRLEIEAIPKEHGAGKMGNDWDGLKCHPNNTQLACPGMRGTGLPGCARARAST